MSILSLDISSSCTGWCYTEDGKLFTRGVIKIPKKLKGGERLCYFREKLYALFKELSPKHVVQEDVFAGPNVKTLKILAEFAGVAKALCFDLLSYEADIVSNMESKGFFHATGKEDLFDFVCKIFEYKDLTFKSDNDMIDAQAQLVFYADEILGKYKYRIEHEFGYQYVKEYYE